MATPSPMAPSLPQFPHCSPRQMVAGKGHGGQGLPGPQCPLAQRGWAAPQRAKMGGKEGGLHQDTRFNGGIQQPRQALLWHWVPRVRTQLMSPCPAPRGDPASHGARARIAPAHTGATPWGQGKLRHTRDTGTPSLAGSCQGGQRGFLGDRVGWLDAGQRRSPSPSPLPRLPGAPAPPPSRGSCKLGQSVYYLTQAEELGPGAGASQGGLQPRRRGVGVGGGQGQAPTALGQGGNSGGQRQEPALNQNDFIILMPGHRGGPRCPPTLRLSTAWS